MSEDKKLCPMKLTIETPPIKAVMGTDIDRFCDEEKCAWWFGNMGCCTAPAIANLLFHIEEHIRWRKH